MCEEKVIKEGEKKGVAPHKNVGFIDKLSKNPRSYEKIRVLRTSAPTAMKTGTKLTTVALRPVRLAVSITSWLIGIPTPMIRIIPTTTARVRLII